MPLLCASDTQRGHAKPGNAQMACQRLTGGSCQARRCLSGGPALDMGLRQARWCPSGRPALDRGVALSPVMPLCRASAGHRGHPKPGDAPLAYQRLTGGSSQAWRCPSCVPAILRGVTPSPAMPQWRASAWQVGRAKPGDASLAGQRLTQGCTKPGDAPLAGQHSTGELR